MEHCPARKLTSGPWQFIQNDSFHQCQLDDSFVWLALLAPQKRGCLSLGGINEP